MAEIDLLLPDGWCEVDDLPGVMAAFERETEVGAKFVVSVDQPSSDPGRYTVRLSTIERESTPTRHDYQVEKYDDFAAAVEGVQEFLVLFSERLNDGTVPPAEPSVQAVRSVIREFAGERRSLSITGLLRRLRPKFSQEE